MGIAVDRHVGALGQGGPQRSAQLGGKLRREVNVDHARHAKAREERTAALVAPDNAVLDRGPGLDFLVRPELDVRVEYAALAQYAVVANHDALIRYDVGLDTALAGHNHPPQLARFPDVVIAPDDAALDPVVVINDGIVADHGRPVDAHIALDLYVVAQVNRAKQLGAGGNLDVFTHPDTATQVRTDRLREAQLAVEHIGIGLHILANVADITPVTVRDIAVERLGVRQYARKQL